MMAMVAVGIVLAAGGCGGAKQPASGTADNGGTMSGEAPATLAPGAPADFAVCTGCHSIVAGQNGIAPSLRGVVGRKAGSLPGYAYSRALRGSGIVWTPQTLDVWLSGPMSMVPGTKMSFGGYTDAKQRRTAIDYLRTLK